MSQPIQSYGQNPYAEEALRLAEIGRGQEGMSRTAAPVGPNLALGGPMAQPMLNSQPYSNERLTRQNESQNYTTAVPQAQAAAVNNLNVQRTAEAQVAKRLLIWLLVLKQRLWLQMEQGILQLDCLILRLHRISKEKQLSKNCLQQELSQAHLMHLIALQLDRISTG